MSIPPIDLDATPRPRRTKRPSTIPLELLEQHSVSPRSHSQETSIAHSFDINQENLFQPIQYNPTQSYHESRPSLRKKQRSEPGPQRQRQKSEGGVPAQQHQQQQQRQPQQQQRHDSVSSSKSSRSDFSESVKRTSKRIAKEKCFVCDRQDGLDVCHVIAQADIEFNEYAARGILPFTTPGNLHNAILLCKICHWAFDRPTPGFIILPTDLSYFIDCELADFAARSTDPSRKKRRRMVPTAEIYQAHLANTNSAYRDQLQHSDEEGGGGLYQIYLRRDHIGTKFAKVPLGPLGDVQRWQGSPTALILHAARVLGCPNPKSEWIPEEELQKLWTLVQMWRKEPEGWEQDDDDGLVEDTPVSIDNDEFSQQSESYLEGDYDDDAGQEGSEASGRQRVDGSNGEWDAKSSVTSYCGDTVSKHKRQATLYQLNSQDGGKKKRLLWQWGPNACSNDVLDVFCRTKSIKGLHIPS